MCFANLKSCLYQKMIFSINDKSLIITVLLETITNDNYILRRFVNLVETISIFNLMTIIK